MASQIVPALLLAFAAVRNMVELAEGLTVVVLSVMDMVAQLVEASAEIDQDKVVSFVPVAVVLGPDTVVLAAVQDMVELAEGSPVVEPVQ